MSKTVKLYNGDKRCATLLAALEEVIYERGADLPMVSVIGVLELLKISVLKDQGFLE